MAGTKKPAIMSYYIKTIYFTFVLSLAVFIFSMA
jgi:hypothetical protein